MNKHSIVIIILGIAHALILALLIPLYFKMIPRNLVYGFRLRNAMQSDEAWLIINKKSAGYGIVYWMVATIMMLPMIMSSDVRSVLLQLSVIIGFVMTMAITSCIIDKSYEKSSKSAQQVDSAEASTIAVHPSDPSGSPR